MSDIAQIAALLANADGSYTTTVGFEYAPKLTAVSIEAKIFELEGVRIVLRAPKLTTFRSGYKFTAPIADEFPLSSLVNRIKDCLGLSVHDYVIVDGHGQTRHNMDVTLETLRASYAR